MVEIIEEISRINSEIIQINTKIQELERRIAGTKPDPYCQNVIKKLAEEKRIMRLKNQGVFRKKIRRIIHDIGIIKYPDLRIEDIKNRKY